MIKNNKYPLLLLLSLLLLISSSIFAKTTTENIERLEQSQQAKHLQKLNRLPNSVVEKLQAGRKKQDPTQILRKNYDVNLLLLLVDFIPDDDPKTTGNGKFDYGNYDIVELDGKLDSIRTICSPPHDSTYFHTLITAMQYYYQSASLGALNFDNFNFRIFPTQADTAYHLPNKMAYYFPDTDDWDFKTERLIQSFKDIIKTADTTNFANTPDINFSEYTDIMIIHAGSDWQHDIFGDTPCDLPAMYVELEDDSVAVDNDSTYVKSAGFSPETISQDFYKDKNILYGFGSVTSELFHEFGHSLGFVDLYNTILNIPAVGYWDIMDSGGLPMVTTIDSSMGKPDTIAIEGALPTLPSAWSRNLIWGEYFEEHGKCITVTSPTEGNLYIDAAEIPDASNPQFVKIPINNSEYYLLENRQTDLNGDGAPLLKLDASGRVPMYPADPETEEINYEFDFMLPTWDNFKKANTNGGLCIWHVDDHIIYEETVISDGKVYNRFDANRINSQYNNRGVKLVEADGIKDIGNLNSFRPYGTPYEAFFRVKAGEWSPTDTNRFHNYHFGSETKPATFSNADVNSHIEIFDISNASSTMSFKFQYDFYHNLTRNKIPSKFNTTNEILVFEDNYYDSQNILYTSDSTLFVNNDLFGKFTYNFNSALPNPLSLLQNDNDYILGTLQPDSIFIIKYDLSSTPIFQINSKNTGDPITDSPFALDQNTICVPTKNSLLLYDISGMDLDKTYYLEKSTEKIAYNPSNKQIIAVHSPSSISTYDSTLTQLAEYEIPEKVGNYYPIISTKQNNSIIFLQDNNGSVYKCYEDEVDKIFETAGYPCTEISNIAFGDVNYDGEHDIVFTGDDNVFALSQNGALLSHFPKILYKSSYQPASPLIGHNLLAEGTSLLLSTDTDYTQTISQNCKIEDYYCFAFGRAQASPYLLETRNFRNLIYPESDSLINIISLNKPDNYHAKMYWNGYKNGPERWSYVEPAESGHSQSVSSLSITTYPNPASYGDVRIKIKSPEEQNASVKIFNLSAELLFSDSKNLEAGINNEFVWNIADVTSGVYFARLKVGNNEKLIKIGVTK